MEALCCRYVFDGKPPELKKEELGRRYVPLSSLCSNLGGLLIINKITVTSRK